MRAVATAGAEQQYDGQLAVFDDLFAKGDLDQVVNACTTCIAFYDRWFDDAARRDGLERRIVAAAGRLAPVPAITQLTALADAAARHDPARANAMIADIEARLRTIRWQAGDELPMRARLAAVRATAGDKAQAVVELDQVVTDYEHQREHIESMNRADVLVPIAEAYAHADAPAQAEAIYHRALAEAVVNPNSRPRLDDLVAVALSLSRSGLPLAAALLAEVRAAVRGLGNPW
ncbi:MAG: hypothetical protein U1E73_13140 [Planctomycetota bacterium]